MFARREPSRRRRPFRPALGDHYQLEERVALTRAAALHPVVVRPAAPTADAPTLSRQTYQGVLAAVDRAFDDYQGKSSVAARVGNALLSAASSILSGPDTTDPGARSTDGEGNYDRLVRRLHSAVGRLPFGASALDPAIRAKFNVRDVTPASAGYFREWLKAQVRRHVVASVRGHAVRPTD